MLGMLSGKSADKGADIWPQLSALMCEGLLVVTATLVAVVVAGCVRIPIGRAAVIVGICGLLAQWRRPRGSGKSRMRRHRQHELFFDSHRFSMSMLKEEPQTLEQKEKKAADTKRAIGKLSASTAPAVDEGQMLEAAADGEEGAETEGGKSRGTTRGRPESANKEG